MVQGNKQSEISDFTGFDSLFVKNHQFLCMIATNIVRDDFVAKDLVQDFFVKYWQMKDQLAPKNFAAYAYRSVKNSCLNYLKHQVVEDKYYVNVSQAVLESLSDETQDDVEELPERVRRLKRILELLDELPADRRKVFELHAIEGLSYLQIAARLGISVNTVKTQLRRAYSTLRGKAITILVLSCLIKYL